MANILLNSNNNIKNKLIELISTSNNYKLIFSYISKSGLNDLKDSLENSCGELLTSTDGFVTDYFSLKYLFDLSKRNNKFKFKVLNSQNETNEKGFHVKSAIFYFEDHCKIWVGSSNISYTSFSINYEQVLLENYDLNSSEKLEFESNYNKLISESNCISNESDLNTFIENYKLISSIRKNVNLEIKKYFENNKVKNSIELREMQKEAINKIQKEVENGKNKALVVAATGTGKTILAAAHSSIYNAKKILFVVHNNIILNQAKDTFQKYFYPFSNSEVLTSHNYEYCLSNDCKIVFATPTILKNVFFDKNNQEKLEVFDYVVFDEAHRTIGAKFSEQIFDFFDQKNAFILGITATHIRSDNPKKIENKFGGITYKIDIADAIINGFLAKPIWYGISTDTDLDTDFSDDLQGEIKLFSAIDKALNELSTIQTWDKGKLKCLIFLSRTRNCQKAANYINNKNYSFNQMQCYAKSITANDNTNWDDIKYDISDLENDNNNLSFLVTVNKFNEGIDIPTLNTLILLRPSDSHIINVQQIGRGLRKKDNKFTNIIDMVGRHKNDYQKLVSQSLISGKSPAVITEKLINKYFESKNLSNNEKVKIDESLIIEKQAIANILNNLRAENFSYNELQRHISENLIENANDQTIDLIKQIVNETKLSIGEIIHFCRNGEAFTKNETPWLLKINKNIELKKSLYPLVEALTWFPLTVSSVEEKKLIIDLLNGEEVNFKNKWLSYFLGTNSNLIENLPKSQHIDINGRDFFETNNSKRTIKLKSEILKNHLFINEVKALIHFYLDQNNKLKIKSTYTRIEIAFMFGYNSILQSGRFKEYSKSDELNALNVALTNKISQAIVDDTGYDNKIVDKSKFILSYDGYFDEKGLKIESIVHNFISPCFYSGNDKRNKRFMYVGSTSDISIKKHDVKTLYELKDNIKIEKKKYERFVFQMNEELTELEMFNYIENYLEIK